MNIIGKQGPCITKVWCLLLIVINGTITVAVSHESENVTTLRQPYCELWNAALCKPAEMIDVNREWYASLAVDGNRDGDMRHMSCFHTQWKGANNWWMVDLRNVFLVHQVVVSNRVGGRFAHKFQSVSIDLYVSDPKLSPGFPTNTDGVRCLMVTHAFEGTMAFDCATPTYARYVKLLKTTTQHFHACEIDVMVSNKQGETECSRTVSKSFDIYKNSNFEIMDVAHSISLNHALQCVEMCRREGYLCNGCLWSPDPGTCQILRVEPRDSDKIVVNSGTDLYAESPITC